MEAGCLLPALAMFCILVERHVRKGSWTSSNILLCSVPICNSFSAHSKAWTNECVEDTWSKVKQNSESWWNTVFLGNRKEHGLPWGGAWRAREPSSHHQWRGISAWAPGKTETHLWEWDKHVGKPHLSSVLEKCTAGYVMCGMGTCCPLGPFPALFSQ